MEDSLTTSLLITAIGMTLLFLSLVLFYGILSLLTAITREKPPTASPEGSKERTPQNRALQAAALAIILARLETAQGNGIQVGTATPSSEDEPTPWWSLHHQQRLAAEKRFRRLG